MLLKVHYDGFELTRYITIKRIIPNTTNRTHLFYANSYHGRKHRRLKDDGLTLTIEAYIREEVMNARDELAKILYGRKHVCDLIVSDYPDRVLKCRFDGEIKPTSRLKGATITLDFVSEYPYYVGINGRKTFSADGHGVLAVNNTGTYETAPKFDVRFSGECGYVSLVSPWGHIGVGNPNEVDRIDLPPKEHAILDVFTSLSGWSKMVGLERHVTDYREMSSMATARTHASGMWLNPSSYSASLANKWQGHAYTKEFERGTVGNVAENFRCRVDVSIQNTTGNRANTCALLVIVMDSRHRPIMTTSIYDAWSDQNLLATSFKRNTLGNDVNHSTIIHNGKLPELLGYIEMKKIGNRFEWTIGSDQSDKVEAFQQGDTVYIKDSAVYGYHDNGTQHTVKSFTRGRAYQIERSRTFGTRKQHAIAYKGTRVYWMYEDDLQTTHSQPSRPRPIRHTLISDKLANMQPARVTIWQASFGNTSPYNRFIVHSCQVERIHTADYLEVKNVFNANDRLEIDCQTGDILLNGATFQGAVDVDSRFFKLPYGETELRVHHSSWANRPQVSVSMEERFV